MGIFQDAAEKLKLKADQLVANSDVVQQVRMTFEVTMEGIRGGSVEVPEFYKLIPGVWAGQLIEPELLDSSILILDQLQLDGKRAEPVEVKTKMIEAVRDLKIRSLEQDGSVSIFDQGNINSRTGAFKLKARSYLLAARRFGDSIQAALDRVEEQMLEEVIQQSGSKHEVFMRPAQAVIAVVAELRVQQLANG